MSKQQNSSRARAIVIAAIFGTFLAACAHQPGGNQVSDGLSPFNAARNQALSLVVSAKRTLDATDLNTLTVAYTGLEEKASAYASFIVEAVTTSSFDPNRNSQYAANLQQAIASFDKTFATLVTTKQTLVSSAWLPGFAQRCRRAGISTTGHLPRCRRRPKPI